MNARIITTLFSAILAAGIFAQPAAATPNKTKADNCVTNNDGRRFCGEAATAKRATAMQTSPERRPARRAAVASYASADQGATIIGGRPSDCPHAYCGCGLRKFLGLEDKRLNLAWNWAKFFPRESAPRAGLAAVRRSHVMYIESSAGDGQWLVRDYNSGGGLSRLHVRDVRGYVFVNPRSQLAAR